MWAQLWSLLQALGEGGLGRTGWWLAGPLRVPGSGRRRGDPVAVGVVTVCSVAGVSPEVSELLMEAQLLQVTLPEIQELYRTLLAKPSPAPQTGRSSPGRPGGEKVSVWWGGGRVSAGSRCRAPPPGLPPRVGSCTRVAGFFRPHHLGVKAAEAGYLSPVRHSRDERRS